MRDRSLIRRLVAALVLAELLCMAALTAVSVVHERRVRLHAVDVALRGRVDSLFGAVQDAEDAEDTVILDPREMPMPREDVFAVYDLSGRLLGASPHAPPALIEPGPDTTETRHLGRRTYRVMRRARLRIIDRAESGGIGLKRPVTIVYATPLNRLWHEVFEGVGFFLGASLLLLLGTTVFMVQIMRSVLRPIGELASAAAAVSPRRLHFNAPAEAAATRELQPLATALTAMITELQVAFERQHRFLGDAAHELKTAVAVVRSSLEVLLLRPRSAPEYEAGLRAAVQDNVRVDDLISRMLLMARVEEPRPAHGARADLLAVSTACLDRLRTSAEQAGVRLEQVVHADPPVVALDAHDLEVLLNNLLMNAVEHSPRGASVVLAVRNQEAASVVSVVDHGTGIPPEALAHIFERFYRADSSRARATGGAGLGLAISKAIVEGAGGTIAVASRPGEGTTMTVRLPLAVP